MLFVPRNIAEQRFLIFADDLRNGIFNNDSPSFGISVISRSRVIELFSFMVGTTLPKGVTTMKLAKRLSMDHDTFLRYVKLGNDHQEKTAITYLSKQDVIANPKSFIYQIPIILAKLQGVEYDGERYLHKPVSFNIKSRGNSVTGYRLADSMSVSMEVPTRKITIRNQLGVNKSWLVSQTLKGKKFVRSIPYDLTNQDKTLLAIHQTLIEIY